jgi:hypothetical protein
LRRFAQFRGWDVILFLILTPVVLVMSSQLPGDWANHRGDALGGTAIVTKLEPLRRGYVVLVDVTSSAGQVVARHQEVNGDAPQNLGDEFAVTYLPPDDSGNTQVYVAGYDPMRTNLLVLIPCLLVWLGTLPFLVARLRRAARWYRARRGRGQSRVYRAGRGYVRE